MAKAAIITGVLLMVMGVGFYIRADTITALIPAFIGLPILIAGIIARDETKRKHAMHAAVLFALLGFLGSLMGFPKWIALLQGQAIGRPLAAWQQLFMAIICLVFIVLAVRSFIAARRARV